jgi:hypothetical protein
MARPTKQSFCPGCSDVIAIAWVAKEAISGNSRSKDSQSIKGSIENEQIFIGFFVDRPIYARQN